MLTYKDILATASLRRWLSMAATVLILQARPSIQQTYTTCNPTQGQCPADTALGKSMSFDFRNGQSNDFYSQGNPTFSSSGVSFTVAKSGDSPQLMSKWYIMFGKVDITMKAASGAGIVSSSVLQSDDLDEIDWEWIGSRGDQVQSNYFGKGQTTSYNRGAVHTVSGATSTFHKYTIDWTSDRIVWQIDGVTVRVLNANQANGQYPQTPMQFKFGAWSGGDPSNAPGTIQWADGPTDYSKGPFSMVVQSISVVDYSTGTQYKYGDTSGTWGSIQAVGGKVNGNAGGASAPEMTPAITQAAAGAGNIMPLTMARYTGSAWVTPTVYPWVPQTTFATAVGGGAAAQRTLPAGWTTDSAGRAVPINSGNSVPIPALVYLVLAACLGSGILLQIMI